MRNLHDDLKNLFLIGLALFIAGYIVNSIIPRMNAAMTAPDTRTVEQAIRDRYKRCFDSRPPEEAKKCEAILELKRP